MNLVIPKHIGLYIHLPWCIKKCPYCDFNSHQLRGELDDGSYIDALLNDFEFEINRLESKRTISSIFIGGGTPSLFSAESIDRLLTGIRAKYDVCENLEITLEANPGAADESRFKGYRQAGVNRLSIGIQSFNQQQLRTLGRIHNGEQAFSAVEMAKSARFKNFNLDLMYCLPEQTPQQALADVQQAVALAPAHISAYHLTIEPNTLFAQTPPVLPDEGTGWEIQQAYWSILRDAGYHQYEISAYSQPGYQCRHNLNYWRFGDYLGIGAGAHGKITTKDGIYRTLKSKHPNQYLRTFAGGPTDKDLYMKSVPDYNLPLEFMMNKLRLHEKVSINDYQQATGLNYVNINHVIEKAVNLQLLESDEDNFRVSEKGRLFLDDLLQLFLAENIKESQRCYG